MNIVYNMDCMQGMKEYPDNYFDLAVVDPPYGIGAHKGWGAAKSEKWKNPKKVIYPASTEWDKERPKKNYFQELFRISKNQIIWGGNYFTNNLPVSRGWLVWVKDGQSPSTKFGACELAFTSFDMVINKYDYAWTGFGAVNAKEERIHPTQKPVALYKWILKNYAKEGDKILDTHLGSGSSRIAAYDMGFDFVGYEIDKTYYDLQEQRFKDHTAQIQMFV